MSLTVKEDLMEKVCKACNGKGFAYCRMDASDCLIRYTIKTAPEVKPVEAEWRQIRLSVPKGKGQTRIEWACTNCGYHVKKRTKHCPECGAVMRN
jgi:lipopolysaccharide biosynthesis regulator YciM